MSPARDREAIDQAIVRGSEQLKQGRLDLAQGSFREALALEPSNIKVLALLGLTYFRASQFNEARPIYEQLVELAPNDASHRLNLGLVYLKIGDGEHAIESLEASRALDPSQGRAISYLGLAYARTGRYVEAYRAFLMAGQNELASEIEINLTAAERDQIQAQVGRGPTDAAPSARSARTSPPGPPPGASEEPRRTPTPHTIPRVDVRAAAQAPSLTESQQFVLPQSQGVPVVAPGQSMVSMAVAAAAPITPQQTLTKAGGIPPRPLSELATEDLVRPSDSDEPFEITAGALVMRVTDRLMTRLEGVHVTGGDLAYERATRRSRGHQTDERFDYGGAPLYIVTGHGYLVAVPGDREFSAVLLDDDILYLREDLVFAFEGSLRWENGNVPGLRGKLPVVQFRGDGALVVRTRRPLVRVKLAANGGVLVDADRIAGWIGRVIPRAVVPAVDGPLGAMCVECSGEGIVLVEPAADDRAAAMPVVEHKAVPPPPPPSTAADEARPAIDPEVAAFAEEMARSDDRLDEI